MTWLELSDGGAIEYVVRCSARLNRCCGEGPLTCERESDHTGFPHTSEGVDW